MYCISCNLYFSNNIPNKFLVTHNFNYFFCCYDCYKRFTQRANKYDKFITPSFIYNREFCDVCDKYYNHSYKNDRYYKKYFSKYIKFIKK